jgi:hypothetical protein
MAKKKNLQLHPKHCKKIADLKPHLLDAVHTVLKSHGVDAVVHSISFRPGKPVAMTMTGGLSGGPCGAAPCCMINGVWTCPG